MTEKMSKVKLPKGARFTGTYVDGKPVIEYPGPSRKYVERMRQECSPVGRKNWTKVVLHH